MVGFVEVVKEKEKHIEILLMNVEMQQIGNSFIEENQQGRLG